MVVPARDEERCRARVRLLTERAFRCPLEPLSVMMVDSRRFKWRRELPMLFGWIVTAWLVTGERNRDECRAVAWEVMEGELVRVSSVKDGRMGGGCCEVDVGVIARCEEQAEELVREQLDRAWEHGVGWEPMSRRGESFWIERRFRAQIRGFCG